MEIFQFKYIDDVTLRQPEVRLWTTTFEILRYFGQELPLTPKVKMTFNVT